MISRNRPHQRRLGRNDVGGGGGLATTTVLKLVWLLASALFLVSVLVTLTITTNAQSSPPSYREEQLSKHHLHRQPARKTRNDKDNLSDQKESSIKASSSLSKDEEVLLKWLRERDNNPTSPADGLPQMLSSPVYFTPGTLPLSQLSTLQQCYTDPTIYGKHLREKLYRRVPYSEKHKLAYLLLPKSGSSTGRFMMKHEFDAVEKYVNIQPPLNVIAFVRDPLSRFYSQYDEAYVRTAPWIKVQNQYYVDPAKSEAAVPHPFPYLHEHFHSYHDYEDAFCPPSTRTKRGECIYRATKENGTLASRLERFVQDYDGRSPFDIHLYLQVAMLSSASNGRSIYITELHNTTNSEQDWNAIAKRYLGEKAVLENAKKNKKGDTKESGGVIQGRSFPRRFDKSLVGPKTEQRICELALLDYCCLNFPLPEVCSGNGSRDNDKALSCKMDYDTKGGRIRIQPGTFPAKGA